MSIVQGPTIANPEAFDTVEALRRELHRANDALFSQFLEFGKLNDGANQMAGLINNLLLAHLRGETVTISKLLKDYLAERDRLREKLEEHIESDRIRGLH